MLERNVAEGVHRIEHADVNVYLLEDDDGVTVVARDCPPPSGTSSRPCGISAAR